MLFPLGFRHRTYRFLVSRCWANNLLKLGPVHVEVSGKEFLDSNETYLFMSNHQSHFDLLALIACLPVDFRAIAKRTLFLIPFFGWTMAAAGHINLDRSNPKKALQSVNHAVKRLKMGWNILVFPEGTRNPDPSKGLLPFKNGVFRLALQAGVKIVPVAVLGGKKALRKSELMVQKAQMHIRIGEPISVEGFEGNKQELSRFVRQAIEALIESPPTPTESQ